MSSRQSGLGLDDRRFWARRASLTTRILAVNVIALMLLAGSLFYLDNYRKQLLAERFRLARAEAQITADALETTPRRQRPALLATIGAEQGLRMRLYDAKGQLLVDSFELSGPVFHLVEPKDEPWYQNAARTLDRGMDFVLGTQPIPEYRDNEKPTAQNWPEIEETRLSGAITIRQRVAPDRTPVISAAALVGERGNVLLTTRNAPDITQSVRDARQTLAIIVGMALLISIQLSLFLARTIVRPLRLLVRAAIRVRLGRDRAVVVPRLPDRRDEIGMLARAISDMSAALRQRIDSVESFAADVAHEIKNPLASLRSALEAMDKVDDADLRRQLTGIAAHDVRRIDRLVTEIADASRIDAEMSRTTFEPVDMFRLVEASIAARESRGVDGSCHITLSGTGAGTSAGDCIVPGDAARLERVLENLLDNAASFSPEASTIEVELGCSEDGVAISVSDHGPGIPADAREKVFERFHSLRPAEEDFGSHSGLGLAIARTIIEAHYGTLTAHDRADGQRGARLLVQLPAWEDE
jgi:two-component system sensor histidine kinase ChvG